MRALRTSASSKADRVAIPPLLGLSHATPQAWREASERYHSDGGLVVLDDLLNPRFARSLEPDRLPDEIYRTAHGLYPTDPGQHRGVVVNAFVYEQADPQRRMFRFLELDPIGLDELTLQAQHSWLVYLLALWTDERLRALITAITGAKPNDLRVEFRRMGRGDFIGWHSDTGDGRRLALNYYLTTSSPGTGGELIVRHDDGSCRTIVPRANRLVIFDVDAHDEHRVTPIADDADEQAPRYSLSIWYLE